MKFGSIQKPFSFTWQVEGEELYQISGSYHDLISIQEVIRWRNHSKCANLALDRALVLLGAQQWSLTFTSCLLYY